MEYEARRFYMEKDFSDVIKEAAPRQAKSLMWYVGYIIAAGLIGIAVMLFLTKVVFT